MTIRKMIWKILKIIIYLVLMIIAAFRFGLIVGKNKDKTINKYKKYYVLAMS